MEVGISINGIIKDIGTKFKKTYEKEFGEIQKIFDENNFENHFETEDEFLNFVSDYNLEIYGYSDTFNSQIISHINTLAFELFKDGHTLHLFSSDPYFTITPNFFFLSKIGIKILSVKFLTKDEDPFKHFDYIITTENKFLNTKKKSKIIKYNKESNKNFKTKKNISDLSTLLYGGIYDFIKKNSYAG